MSFIEYTYTFRCVNREQGLHFVSVKHKQKDDVDGAMRVLLGEFRPRHHEACVHFCTQWHDESGKAQVEFANPLEFKWTATIDATPRAHANEFPNYHVTARGSIGYDAKLAYWTRAIDIQPGDIFIDNMGKHHLTSAMEFSSDATLDVVKLRMESGQVFCFRKAEFPVQIVRTQPPLRRGIQIEYKKVEAPACVASCTVGDQRHRDMVVFGDIVYEAIRCSPCDGGVKVRFKMPSGRTFDQPYASEHVLTYLVPQEKP